MTEYEIFKNQTLKLLGEIISYESAKPDDEADFDLIEDCEKMMCDLLEGSATLSDEEIRIRIEKVKQKSQVSKTQKKFRRGFSRVAAALCAVLVLCISVCAVCAISPEIREGIMKSLGISVGESVDVNGITYINNGAFTEYKDIETLLIENNLDIMFPHKLPENSSIVSVCVSEQDTNPVKIILSENSGYVYTYINTDDRVENIKKDAEKIVVNGNEFYYIEIDDQYVALISDDQYTYYISYFNYIGIQTIMEGFYK